MRTVALAFAVALLATMTGAHPAAAWWRFAEWGLSEDQLVAASRGQAVPCRADVAACSSALAGGAAPRLVIEKVDMVGLHGATSFVFDAKGTLVQTIVVFPNVDFTQASGMLHGIHGQPTEDRPGAAAARVWRDEKRHSIITVTASGSGTILTYKPM